MAGVADDGLDVDAVGDDELEQAVGEDLFGVRDRDGADAGDLADLTGFGAAAEQGGEVDADPHGLGLPLLRLGCP